MKIKLSNERIYGDVQKLARISQKELPIKVSYAIAKNTDKIDAELKIFNKERNKLIEKYAEKDDKGKIISDERGDIKFKDKKAWDKDIKELSDLENEFEIHQFPLSALDNINNLSPSEIRAIDYMIDEK
jgi:hypothetical protein